MQRLSLRQPARTRVSAELTMRPILVATDFSDGAKRAVEAAAPRVGCPTEKPQSGKLYQAHRVR